MDSTAKRRVIVAGRRGGKTTGAAELACKAFFAGKRVLEAAPTADQTGAFWDKVQAFLAKPIQDKSVMVNKTNRSIDWANGQPGHMRCKTAWNADTLRGDFADLLIMDEYSIMNPNAWGEVGAPMLLDNDGDAVFIFTPKRKNHAFHLYAKASGDTSGRWGAWHFTSMDNPHLSKTALAEITSDMGADAYRQEIMAEFLDNEGAVFRNLDACLILQESQPSAHAGHNILVGCDWGKAGDYTVYSVGCADCKQELCLDRSNQTDYVVQVGRLQALHDRWKTRSILAESNSIGEPIIEQLVRLNLPVYAFETTTQSKPPLIENLALALEREEWHFLDNPIARLEMESYERKVSAQTGRPSYSAPEGLHDDTVIGRALMLRAANRPSWLI